LGIFPQIDTDVEGILKEWGKFLILNPLISGKIPEYLKCEKFPPFEISRF
jgi:hypothetical protein